jgi:hypothetical protein
MENFVNLEDFKNKLMKLQDNIIDEKSYLYDQIKKLAFEENLLKENAKFFERYLNMLEGNGDISELKIIKKDTNEAIHNEIAHSVKNKNNQDDDSSEDVNDLVKKNF